MKKIILLLVFFLLIQLASANDFYIYSDYKQTDSIRITHIMQRDLFFGRDLNSTIVINFYLNENFSSKGDNLTFVMDAFEYGTKFIGDVSEFLICKTDSPTGAIDLNTSEVVLDCNKIIDAVIKKEKIDKSTRITLDSSKFVPNENYMIKVSYILHNAIMEKTDYAFIRLRFNCQATPQCPTTPNSFFRWVILPTADAVFEDVMPIPTRIWTEPLQDRWVLEFVDYEDSIFIKFIDAKKIGISDPWFWSMYGAIVGAILGAFIELVVLIVIKRLRQKIKANRKKAKK